jgi:hypothetical protein
MITRGFELGSLDDKKVQLLAVLSINDLSLLLGKYRNKLIQDLIFPID